MSVKGAFVMPHPPIILPQVGGGKELEIAETSRACHKAADHIRQLMPDVLVVCSPHGTLYEDYIHISPGEGAKGDFSGFCAPEVKIQVQYDSTFAAAIQQEAEKGGIAAGTRGALPVGLDHGTMIPLWFLGDSVQSIPVVRIGISGLSLEQHHGLGQCIARAAKRTGKQVVFLASGDLSHRLLPEGPYGYAKEGPEFDRRITDIFRSGQLDELMGIPRRLSEGAGECGLRSFVMMAGALSDERVSSHLLSYEGPFGVGYAVASFVAENQTPQEEEDPYVRLARYGVDSYVKTHKIPSVPHWVPKELSGTQAGVFVTLKQQGRLRGCIGTIAPVEDSVAREILRNAASSSTEDPRFPPVSPEELDSLTISVDVLGPPEHVHGLEDLDPKRYGVIVEHGWRRGLLLPDLEGVDTPDGQVGIACSKAGISPGEPYLLKRFQVVRHQ